MFRTSGASNRSSGGRDRWANNAERSLVTNRANTLGRSGVAEAWPRPFERDADDIVCQCLQVTRGTLETCIRSGCSSQEDLARETGVTTACGGCRPAIAQLLGERSGCLVRIIEVREIQP